MNRSTRILGALVLTAAAGMAGAYAIAQQGPGHGPMMGHGMGMHQGMRGANGQDHAHGGPGMHMGAGMGPGMMMGMMGGSATPAEMQELHTMFVDHARIQRTVTNLPNGIRTLTESDDAAVAGTLASHVSGMMKRVEEGRDPRLPMQSPWLDVIFANKDRIKTSFEATANGIAVTQTSDDAATVEALQKHAADVSDLVKRGMVAAHETMMKRMSSNDHKH